MGRSFCIHIFLLLQAVIRSFGSDITNQVFGDVSEGIVAAFGDFNSDELTDVFLIADNMKRLQILYGADTEPLLQQQNAPFCNYEDDIVSVIPGDFDGDAFMDVLVALRMKDKPESDKYQIHINWGSGNDLECSDVPLFSTIGEPMALDFNRDMIMDLYGESETTDSSEKSERMFWIFSKTRNKFEKRRQAAPADSQTVGARLKIPNANAYLDYNEDFTADLFVETEQYYEIWNGRTDETHEDFTYNKTINFQAIGNADYIVGQATFMDFELEGKQNILLPVCINKGCSNSTILVHDGRDFRDIHVNFKDPQGISWGFVPPVKNDVYLRTITARSGDYNMDGYPDILLTLQQLNRAKHMQTFLLENVPCKTCNKPLKRTFEVKWNALYPLGNQTVAGAFYDFYQDGVLDVILVEKTAKGSYKPLAFRNTLDYDANFVKVIVLSGLVNKNSATMRTTLGRKKRTFGANLPGPRIIYSTITQDGDQQSGSSVQLPQSTYFALQLPYTIFGLGRTPNFVDQLTVGVGSKARTWTQLIPNSQIIVLPNPISEPQHWKAQLFVTPSKLILMSVVALGGTCLVIILIILVLYIKEKREDKQEKLQEAHRFHFDAM